MPGPVKPEITEKDLREQEELVKRLGRGLSYQLKSTARKPEVANENNFRSVSSYVRRDGRITFSNTRQAAGALSSLGIKVTFRFDSTRDESDPMRSKPGSFSLLNGCPSRNVRIGVWPKLEIHSIKSDVRRKARIALRKGIWHEIMETALIAIDMKVFNNPEGHRAMTGGDTFADRYVGQFARPGKTLHDYDFYPWLGDSVSDNQWRVVPKANMYCNVLNEPTREIKLEYNTGERSFQATVYDYKFNRVCTLNGPAGEGTIKWGANVEPGMYWIDVRLGSQTSRYQVKIILPKPILWEIELREESKTNPYRNYFKIRPASGSRWPIGKGFGFSLYYHQNVKDRLGRHQLGYVNAGAGKTATLELKLASGNDRPITPDKSYTVWAYVQDPYLDDLLVDDHGGARAGVYIRWARHYIAKK